MTWSLYHRISSKITLVLSSIEIVLSLRLFVVVFSTFFLSILLPSSFLLSFFLQGLESHSPVNQAIMNNKSNMRIHKLEKTSSFVVYFFLLLEEGGGKENIDFFFF